MYRPLFYIIRAYWRDYGGFGEWLSSPFMHFSVVVTTLYAFGIVELDWQKTATGSLPTVLGFSLAAYTITFTLMGSALHRALSAAIDRKSGVPLIRQVNATFFHVVLFQAVALLYSTVTGGSFFWRVLGGHPGFASWKSGVLWITYNGGNALGCFLSTYSFFLLFSVGLAMYRLGRLSGQAPKPSAANSNEQDVTQDNVPAIAKTWRFAVVRFVAKTLRLYS